MRRITHLDRKVAHCFPQCQPDRIRAGGPADYERLCDTLAGITGKFILSLNDTPEVRKTFKRFPIWKISTTYSCAYGRTLSRSELLIHNLKPTREPPAPKAAPDSMKPRPKGYPAPKA